MGLGQTWMDGLCLLVCAQGSFLQYVPTPLDLEFPLCFCQGKGALEKQSGGGLENG